MVSRTAVEEAVVHPLRWRVDELADVADLSVDTIRYYQKRRLLPPPAREGRVAWYGAEHRERLRRIKDLQARGLTLELIGRILDPTDDADAPLAVAVAEAASSGEELLTLDELAGRSGVDPAILETLAEHELLVPRRRDGEPRYTLADVRVVGAGLELLGQGLPFDRLLALARHHHEATADVAEEAVALFDEFVRQPLLAADLEADVHAERLVTAFTALLPAVTALVEHHFRRVLLDTALQHLSDVGEEAEIRAAEHAARDTALERDWSTP